MSTPLVVSFVLTAILGGVLVSLWWGADNDIRDLTDRMVVVEARTQALVDPPTDPIAVPTEPMELHVAGGLRTGRPTPYVRQKGRHSA